jgi:hypothetical protein
MTYAIIFLFAFVDLYTKNENIDPYREVLKRSFIDSSVIHKDESIFLYNHLFFDDIEIINYRLSKITPSTPAYDILYSVPYQLFSDNSIEQNNFERYLLYIYDFVSPLQQNDIALILADLQARKEIWDKIGAFKYLYRDDRGVRLRLAELKELVGEDNFNKGKWPDPLPAAAYNSEWFYIEQETEIP